MRNDSAKQIDIQGHRGCRGLFPENSLPAFGKAIDLGVNTLELDIVISKDNKVVVSHEPYMNPLICYDLLGGIIPDASEASYNLFNMTYAEIKVYDCGSKFHLKFPNQEKLKTYKPLLAEVFDLAKSKNSDVKFNIEIKSESNYYNIFTPQPKDYVELVLNEINLHNMADRVNLQSFDIAILEAIKNQSSNIKVALLVEADETIAEKLKTLSYQPEIISPYFKLLTAEVVKYYQKRGCLIIPWTINEEKDMKQMILWQVDGIITDYPNRLNEILKH